MDRTGDDRNGVHFLFFLSRWNLFEFRTVLKQITMMQQQIYTIFEGIDSNFSST